MIAKEEDQKLKKFLTALLTSAMLLTMSSSVFAAESVNDTEKVTPYIIGVGDTKSSALTLVPGQNYNLYLSDDSADREWFKWTNTTGQNKYVTAGAIFYNNTFDDFNFGYQVDYGNGRDTTLAYVAKSGSGNLLEFEYLYVPAGASVYFVVDHEKNKRTDSNYLVYLYVKDMD